MAELYVGLMSGTSMDGIDAVLVDLSGEVPQLKGSVALPLLQPLRAALLNLAAGGADGLDRVATLDVEVGRQFAATTLELLDRCSVSAGQIIAIGSHGQTARHMPSAPVPFTVQLGDPSTIAEMTGITTVADFRRRDVAAGGQGAPLVPAFHTALWRTPSTSRAVLNLGGIANITVLPADPALPVSGFDTGPANILLDAWADKHLGTRMDEGGRWADSGRVHAGLLARLSALPYFQLPPPKSTGREDFNLAWLEEAVTSFPPIAAEDVQATLCEFTALTVAEAIDRHARQTEEVFVCGGGAHNGVLINRLRHHLGRRRLRSTEELGLAPDWVEAVAFAWLAKQTLNGRPGNLPEVTGARRPVVLGGIYRA